MFISFILFISLWVACSQRWHGVPDDVAEVLKKAGPNRDQLLKVIRHYDKDESKLEAAYYLIRNLHHHFSSTEVGRYKIAFEKASQQVNTIGFGDTVNDDFNRMVDSIRALIGPEYPVLDLYNITADYLIENIDLAFEAYHHIPENLRCSKELFLRYVLPYRINHEPIEPGLRKQYFDEFGWVYDVLNSGGSLEKAVCMVVDSLALRSVLRFNCTGAPISAIRQIRFGNCSAVTATTAFVLRALGIPAASDMTPAWSNTTTWIAPNSAVHEWTVFFSNNGFHAIDGDLVLNRMYAKEGLSKVYRREFEFDTKRGMYPGHTDVTDQYVETVELSMDGLDEAGVKDGEQVVLATFSSTQDWVPVMTAQAHNAGVTFSSVGRDVVYGIRRAGNFSKLCGFPAYVGVDGQILSLNPREEKEIRARIVRKWPPYIVRNLRKVGWSGSLNGCKIQGANRRDFLDAVTLLVIRNFNSPHQQTLRVRSSKRFKYYRLLAQDSSFVHLATFRLLGSNDNLRDAKIEITGRDGNAGPNGRYVFDDDPLTYVTGQGLRITYELPEPEIISGFKVQTRNDGNDIIPGHTYELMYWNGGWKSLGRQLAKDTVLTYDNVPAGGLYLLRNLSGGKEEGVFMLDDQGNQVWPGINKLGSDELFHPHIFALDSLCGL